jgi:hypothetical protein
MATIDNTIRMGGTKILRNPDLLPLEDAQLKRFAPTIFAKRPIEGVSDNYGFVNTFDIIKAMRDSGYPCVEVRQSQRRDESKMPYTKHMLKFKHPSTMKALLKRGDVIPQVVMLNSHDRSSGFHLYYGMFRILCMNGLIVSTGELVEPIKVRHSLSMVADIVERSRELIRGADGVYRLREDMLKTMLSDKQAIQFASKALEFRPPRRAGILEPATLLTVRREEDRSNDLWHVFNRVQENMMRGGSATLTENGRAVQTKGIGRIERDVQVNSALWSLAVEGLDKYGKGKPTAKRSKKQLTAEEILG